MTLDAGNTSRETILVHHERRGTDTLAMIKGNGDLAYDEIVRDKNWADAEVRRGGIWGKLQDGLSYPQHGRRVPRPAVSRP